LTSWRRADTLAAMSAAPKRATIYLPPSLHRALRMKAAAADRSISDLVSEAVRMSLAEDAEDLEAFEKRSKERSLRFEDVVKSLRRRGKL
jgi:plasmid stability protein